MLRTWRTLPSAAVVAVDPAAFRLLENGLQFDMNNLRSGAERRMCVSSQETGRPLPALVSLTGFRSKTVRPPAKPPECFRVAPLSKAEQPAWTCDDAPRRPSLFTWSPIRQADIVLEFLTEQHAARPPLLGEPADGRCCGAPPIACNSRSVPSARHQSAMSGCGRTRWAGWTTWSHPPARWR